MTTDAPAATNGATDKDAPTQAAPTKAKKPVEIRPTTGARPTRALPTTRIAFAKQMDLLRAFDAAAGPMQNPITLTTVGSMVKIAPTTISLANPFFVDVGLIRKAADTGKIVPHALIHEYALAYQWDAEKAAHKLAPAFAQTWFWQVLEPRLRYQQMPEHEAIALLAQSAEAAPEYRPQLLQILTFLDAVGLIVREGNLLRLGSAVDSGAGGGSAAPLTEPPMDATGDVRPANGAGPSAAARAGTGSGVATSFTQDPQGVLRFHVSVNVEMSEMRDWKPDRIAALFAGIAQVLAAKAGVEQGAGDAE